MGLSYAQRVALAVAPKFTGCLSLLGSLSIVMDVSKDVEKRQNVYHRLMFVFGLIDVLASFAFMLSTWPIPKDDNHDVLWASGNDFVCNVQGFFIQASSANFVYNASLTIYYVCVIVFNMKERELKKREAFFHIIPLLFGYGTAFASVMAGYFTNANLWCWIAGFDQAYIIRWVFFYAPLWFCFLVVMVGMLAIYWKVRQTEKAVEKYDVERSMPVQESSLADHNNNNNKNNNNNNNNKKNNSDSKTNQVAFQAFLYVVAFYLTFLPGTVNRIYQQVTGGKSKFTMLLLQDACQPLQGALNFFIYKRVSMIKLKRSNEDWSWGKVLWVTLCSGSAKSENTENQSSNELLSSTFFVTQPHVCCQRVVR